jgi:hypothetical protein
MLSDWPAWIILSLLVVYFYVFWEMMYYRRIRTTHQIPLMAFFVLTVVMAAAFALFVLVRPLLIRQNL